MLRLFRRSAGSPVRHAALTDVGKRRDHNEDSFTVVEGQPGWGFDLALIVCDGVGGQPRGEMASQLAISAFREVLSRPDHSPMAERLQLASAAGGAAILDFAQREVGGAPLATTVAALVLAGTTATVAHVGDSRVYRYRARELEALTWDHTFVAAQVKAGLILPTEARTHPLRSRLSQALGVGNPNTLDTSETSTSPGDLFLVCSDGLHAFVEQSDIVAALSDDLERTARKLVDLANAAGGIDNVTVALARVG